MTKALNLVGEKFGRLTLLSRTWSSLRNRSLWKCKCDCGNICEVILCNITSGHTKSCGCLQKEKVTKHGMHNTPTYETWESMKQRCLNKNSIGYKYYGGRGITICEHWILSFENFLKDMGKKPKKMTIERINNDKGYFKENCKWVTKQEQDTNKRSNVYVQYDGKRMCVAEFWRLTKKNKCYATCLKYVKKGEIERWLNL